MVHKVSALGSRPINRLAGARAGQPAGWGTSGLGPGAAQLASLAAQPRGKKRFPSRVPQKNSRRTRKGYVALQTTHPSCPEMLASQAGQPSWPAKLASHAGSGGWVLDHRLASCSCCPAGCPASPGPLRATQPAGQRSLTDRSPPSEVCGVNLPRSI